jgi:uncharacterized protein YecE (DUF72 family)
VSDNPDFVFTAKLNRLFTHERGQATEHDESDFRSGIEPLVTANKLGALLLQFPWSFKNTEEERSYLVRLLKRFQDYPLVLEVRHASWNTPEMYELLEQLQVGICNIDQPLFSKSIKPSAMSTSRIGYVRLHGRNYQHWFREEAPRDDRYDYLYSHEELEPWLVRIKEIAKHTQESYVITNNHFRGQAVVNALELKSTIEGKPVLAPEPLLERYPRLRESTRPEDGQDSTPRLFT